MSLTASPSSGRPYGLTRVCRVWRAARATIYRHRLPPRTETPRRPGPVGPMPDPALAGGDPGRPRGQPLPRRGAPQGLGEAAHRGVRTSRRRVLRLMREHDLLAPSRVGSASGPAQPRRHHHPRHPGHHVGHRHDHHLDGEGQAAVFVAVDHCTAECVGLHAARRGTRFEALEPLRQGVRQHFGGFAKGIAAGLSIRHDHGSQYMSDDFQGELTFLGIESSPAFVRAPEGNGCAERFIRTLKENLLWVRTFDTVEQLRQALLEFRQTYNSTWLIERHGFRTPDALRQDQLSPAALAA